MVLFRLMNCVQLNTLVKIPELSVSRVISLVVCHVLLNLFEARNPSDPAIVSEIDGVVSFGKKLKRGNREVIITSKTGEEKSYLVCLQLNRFLHRKMTMLRQVLHYQTAQ
jgi:hypothetical protein